MVYCRGIFAILQKTWEVPLLIFGVTVCQLWEPRTLWHSAWSGYGSQNLRMQFPFLTTIKRICFYIMVVAWMVLILLSILDLGFLLLLRWHFQDFNYLARSRQKRACRFPQGFVVSGKPLLFAANHCRFRQSFVVSQITLARMSNLVSIYVE